MKKIPRSLCIGKGCMLFLCKIWHVLKILRIDDSNKPGMDWLCHLSYKPFDDVTLFVRILINADDETDATYSESES